MVLLWEVLIEIMLSWNLEFGSLRLALKEIMMFVVIMPVAVAMSMIMSMIMMVMVSYMSMRVILVRVRPTSEPDSNV